MLLVIAQSQKSVLYIRVRARIRRRDWRGRNHRGGNNAQLGRRANHWFNITARADTFGRAGIIRPTHTQQGRQNQNLRLHTTNNITKMTLIKQKSALIRFFLSDSSHQNTEITIRVGACIAVRTQKAFYIYACARVYVRRGCTGGTNRVKQSQNGGFLGFLHKIRIRFGQKSESQVARPNKKTKKIKKKSK